MQTEGIADEKNIFSNIKELSNLDKQCGRYVYINKEFTEQALKILINYQLVKKNADNTAHFWFDSSPSYLREYDVRCLLVSRELNRVSKQNGVKCLKCASLFEDDSYKSNRWCEHALCANCWIKYLREAEPEAEILCPQDGCNFSITPSLLLALLMAYADSEEKIFMLNKRYLKSSAWQKKEQKNKLDKMAGLSSCPLCQSLSNFKQ